MNIGWNRKQGSDVDDETHKDTSLGADPTNIFSRRKERVMTNPTSLRSQIKSLEEQLRVLYALVHPSTTSASQDVYSLADVEGLLQGQTDTPEVDIDAILYQVPPDTDEAV